MLGWLGTDTPDSLGHALPERLAALHEPPTKLVPVPHTLYVHCAHTDLIGCIDAVKIQTVLVRRSCTRAPQHTALRC